MRGRLSCFPRRQSANSSPAHLAAAAMAGVAEDPLPAFVRSVDQSEASALPVSAGWEGLDRNDSELAD